ncbi:mannose-1-phosphate guanylyltransferase/mannose-6-phosphate isomerase [Ferrimonas balearica]|uniref:mannose-1-phosphate guanylyltransferase/mannose-6-phosphate isomerase n=1 Tax=Ferrimonas balearica TaxID=44012 RepID=UPI001C566A7E|nr:mannose-1-phosphate guanylyltransferase/mannose-6-phosphate isomerase [Ferrimonas balearica]MBW3138224.1 mannose-1-phosphate guanylyltransferase/mannose-6-phosphate isomerase [Ferrimonas balearica]MBW3164221.1 mannose-1-phosphate guanylyltransferase/mannose-6-phosphate isomerase [Ferrimonas balearica]
MITPVIMAGGSGSRLWPLSRSAFPKQFLSLSGEGSMLQDTVSRLKGLKTADPITICNEDHRFLVAEQLRAVGQLGSIILEPVGRNTAPAIALAAEIAQQAAQGEDPLLLVLAADHVIRNPEAFITAVKMAVPLAESGKLVTFGIVPESAHTGYGYIRRGEHLGTGFEVDQFVEKPDLATAEAYLQSGEYYWNSGMFLFKASRYLQELEAHRPDIALACSESLKNVSHDLDFVRVDEAAFTACPEDSVDYAVMEKTSDAVVVPLDAGWNDIGSWSALWEVNGKDADGNVCQGDTMLHDTHNCLIQGDERLIATVGVDDLVIVDTKDALMVAQKGRVQEVKRIVESLKADFRSEYQLHREVYRPWGKYDSIDNGQRYQVKRITVKPGAKLSVQMHHHRSEHWIVVSGTAKVTNGEKTVLVSENESTYIPLGVVHALENPGKVPLELIEVQVGSYLGEDDIVRFEDRYGRVEESSDA